MMIYVINAHNKMFSSYMITKILVDVWICFYVLVIILHCKIMFGDTTKIYNLIWFVIIFAFFYCIIRTMYDTQHHSSV